MRFEFGALMILAVVSCNQADDSRGKAEAAGQKFLSEFQISNNAAPSSLDSHASTLNSIRSEFAGVKMPAECSGYKARIDQLMEYIVQQVTEAAGIASSDLAKAFEGNRAGISEALSRAGDISIVLGKELSKDCASFK